MNQDRAPRMTAEYRVTCFACGRDDIKQHKPKITPWHWGTSKNGHKKCYETPWIASRSVTNWQPYGHIVGSVSEKENPLTTSE